MCCCVREHCTQSLASVCLCVFVCVCAPSYIKQTRQKIFKVASLMEDQILCGARVRQRESERERWNRKREQRDGDEWTERKTGESRREKK